MEEAKNGKMAIHRVCLVSSCTKGFDKTWKVKLRFFNYTVFKCLKSRKIKLLRSLKIIILFKGCFYHFNTIQIIRPCLLYQKCYFTKMFKHVLKFKLDITACNESYCNKTTSLAFNYDNMKSKRGNIFCDTRDFPLTFQRPLHV